MNKKRDIFAELCEGFDALAEERQGKITLRSHQVEIKQIKPATAEEIVALRKKLNMSQPVFAQHLRATASAVKNWEQNRAKPNPQATVLIRLLDAHPEIARQLAQIV
ncbi:helix-turn-helix domain-containing protein [Pseudomonas sp. EL_65y_Pfl2_R95]|uniref:helix-turn-helix domain-containing protein n=1 Tax=Pseudomonas sp. EL_65y_Pfl2_R95 TaxID=3088698 RepID=UPI0030D6FDF7